MERLTFGLRTPSIQVVEQIFMRVKSFFLESFITDVQLQLKNIRN